METIALNANVRDKVVSAKKFRAMDRLPVTYYGKGVANINLEMAYQDFRRAFGKGGQNTIMDITVDGKILKGLVHDMQFDPVSDRFTHVDFIAVDLNKEVHTVIPIVFIGVAPAVKDLGGTLMENMDEVNVTCLAKDLIHQIEVDISSLVDFHSIIHVGDLNVPSTITIEDDSELAVAMVEAPKSEEELAAEEAADAAASAAVMEAVKDEGKEEEGGEKGEKGDKAEKGEKGEKAEKPEKTEKEPKAE